MKKILISIFVICALLLSASYIVGKRTESEIQGIFARGERQVSELLSYDRGFFKATAVSRLTLTADGEQPISFEVSSTIYHYPYKAVIDNHIRLLDPQLNAKVEEYFASDSWIRSTEEISLSGQLIGELQLLPGRYEGAEEQLVTKALNMNYRVELRDSSGSFNINWGGLDVRTSTLNASIDSIKLSSDFVSLPVVNKYNYRAEVEALAVQREGSRMQLQDIELLGSNRPGQKEDRLNSSNELKIASYIIDNGEEKVFTDNHLKVELRELFSPALALLAHVSDDPERLALGLSELVAYGGRVSLTKLTSQTPWGEIHGGMDLTLQEGGNLPEIIGNPFMLLDYISGSVSLYLPESMLQLPEFSEHLQVGLQSGILKRDKQVLSLQTQFEQGELTVNGRVIPL